MIFLPAAAPAADLEFIERSERDAAVGTLSIEVQLGDGRWAAMIPAHCRWDDRIVFRGDEPELR
jgi:hypothetical protein